jgi:hypothetical protein
VPGMLAEGQRRVDDHSQDAGGSPADLQLSSVPGNR